jgi:hypothetical protein
MRMGVREAAASVVAGPGDRVRREAMTAPKTVELAAIQVAQPRLPSHVLSSAAVHTTTARP